ncbi:hypothetical protein HID58_075535 [Brassica napus]|uniref:Uncharacterized protein n=1 Tax=Brassica napus TaxID=3708 RepID=A0ABQ7YMK1_BRANA|nr:hypothetical protein HID58_075535 [Brassica napus]
MSLSYLSKKEMEPTAATAAAVIMKIKKSKSVPNGDGAASRSWSFSDPESRRKRRVAGYKVYSVKDVGIH